MVDAAADAAAVAAAAAAVVPALQSTRAVRRSANPSRRGVVARRSTTARLRYVLNI